MTDAEQRDEVAMPPGLRKDTFARVDEDDRQVRGRRTSNHVARVLLVSRRVGGDELSPRGAEQTVRDVDRDALLALGGETVEQQGIVQVAVARTDALRVSLEGRHLVDGQEGGVVQQAAEQRALAVVDTPAGDEPQKRATVVRGRIRDGRRLRFPRERHQK